MCHLNPLTFNLDEKHESGFSTMPRKRKQIIETRLCPNANFPFKIRRTNDHALFTTLRHPSWINLTQPSYFPTKSDLWAQPGGRTNCVRGNDAEHRTRNFCGRRRPADAGRGAFSGVWSEGKWETHLKNLKYLRFKCIRKRRERSFRIK